MTVTIRPMSPDDAVPVAELTSELGYTVTPADIADRCKALAGADGSVAFVAEEAGLIVGWVQALDRLLLQEKRVLEIGGLVVKANRRGEGVGALLTGAVARWAHKNGHTTLFVRSNVAREDAHHFYPALGFALQKTSHTYIKELD